MAVAMQAGQAVEPAALIPLQMLAPHGTVVLVGDPMQLPATVISRAAEKAGLSLSLFERLSQVQLTSLCLPYAWCCQCDILPGWQSRPADCPVFEVRSEIRPACRHAD